ncbi:hypothetical protein AB0F88_17270 [Streptosporangium sp. NPDC023963]|uniref:hypothetical protein n=1 Tax=Streptosporangium sp. NPDC023963 TaxID=3155608 RepID=UPI0034134BCB
MSVVLPDLHPVAPDALTNRHIIRVTASPILAANDVYGFVRATKRFGGGSWRIRWEAAVAVAPGEPRTGILHVRPGEVVSCISRAQWLRLPRRLTSSTASEGEKR